MQSEGDWFNGIILASGARHIVAHHRGPGFDFFRRQNPLSGDEFPGSPHRFAFKIAMLLQSNIFALMLLQSNVNRSMRRPMLMLFRICVSDIFRRYSVSFRIPVLERI